MSFIFFYNVNILLSEKILENILRKHYDITIEYENTDGPKTMSVIISNIHSNIKYCIQLSINGQTIYIRFFDYHNIRNAIHNIIDSVVYKISETEPKSIVDYIFNKMASRSMFENIMYIPNYSSNIVNRNNRNNMVYMLND